MDTTCDIIIAVVAVAGFLFSISMSIITLRQTNKLNEKQNKIASLDTRMQFLTKILNFFNCDIKDKKNKDEIFALKMLLPLLFTKKDLKQLNTLFEQLTLYYDDEAAFPDYTAIFNITDDVAALRLCGLALVASLNNKISL